MLIIATANQSINYDYHCWKKTFVHHVEFIWRRATEFCSSSRVSRTSNENYNRLGVQKNINQKQWSEFQLKRREPRWYKIFSTFQRLRAEKTKKTESFLLHFVSLNSTFLHRLDKPLYCLSNQKWQQKKFQPKRRPVLKKRRENSKCGCTERHVRRTETSFLSNDKLSWQTHFLQ